MRVALVAMLVAVTGGLAACGGGGYDPVLVEQGSVDAYDIEYAAAVDLVSGWTETYVQIGERFLGEEITIVAVCAGTPKAPDGSNGFAYTLVTPDWEDDGQLTRLEYSWREDDRRHMSVLNSEDHSERWFALGDTALVLKGAEARHFGDVLDSAGDVTITLKRGPRPAVTTDFPADELRSFLATPVQPNLDRCGD